MSHVPHEIAEDFPSYLDRYHLLKTTDAHFSRLVDQYHEVNRAVHRAETDVEPTSDDHIAELRKERMTLKDRIWLALSED